MPRASAVEVFFRRAVPEWSRGSVWGNEETDQSNRHRVDEYSLEDDVVRVAPPGPTSRLGVQEVEFDDGIDADYEGTLHSRGIDFIAFYRSYHRHGPDWGIYFYVDRLAWLAGSIRRRAPGIVTDDLPEAIRAAVDRHELFHFRTELAVTRLEVATGRPLYADYGRLYRDAFGSDDCLEEALANATKFREMRKKPTELRDELMDVAKRSGGGYRDFERHMPAPAYRDGLAELTNQIALPLGWRIRSGELMDRPAATAYERSVPRYLILSRPWGPTAAGDGNVVRLLVPSSIRTLPLRKVEAHARRMGAVVGPGGRHSRGISHRGARIPLPDRRDVDPYLIKQLARTFGLSRDDYVRAVLGE